MYATMIVFFTDHRQLVSVSTKLDNVHHFAVFALVLMVLVTEWDQGHGKVLPVRVLL